jgi:hypothetical protein
MVYAVSDYRVLGFTTSTLGLVLTPVHIHRFAVYTSFSLTLTSQSYSAKFAPDDEIPPPLRHFEDSANIHH